MKSFGIRSGLLEIVASCNLNGRTQFTIDECWLSSDRAIKTLPADERALALVRKQLIDQPLLLIHANDAAAQASCDRLNQETFVVSLNLLSMIGCQGDGNIKRENARAAAVNFVQACADFMESNYHESCLVRISGEGNLRCLQKQDGREHLNISATMLLGTMCLRTPPLRRFLEQTGQRLKASGIASLDVTEHQIFGLFQGPHFLKHETITKIDCIKPLPLPRQSTSRVSRTTVKEESIS